MLSTAAPNRAFKNKWLSLSWYNLAILTIFAGGIFFRLFHFFNNPSLWEDEVYLSSGIINLSFKQLITGALPYFQKAPLGYLLVVKAFVSAFGNSEIVLRFYPLICGLISLFLFEKIAKHYLNHLGTMVALAILAFAPPLIYHSVEAKPYGSEMLATLIIILLFIRYQKLGRVRSLISIGFAMAVMVWFAYTAIFVLLATALALGLIYISKKQWRQMWLLFIPVTMALVSFGIVYIFFAREGSKSDWLIYFWAKHSGYLPLSPVKAAVWIMHSLITFLHYPLGLSWYNNWFERSAARQLLNRMILPAVIFLLAGIIILYKKNRTLLLVIASNFLVAFVASAAKQYPFHERLTVYLAPFLILLIAAGCQIVFRSQLLTIMRNIFIIMLLFGPLKNSIGQTADTSLFGDYKKSFQREAIEYLSRNIQPSDLIYVYWTDKPGFNFYNSTYRYNYKTIQGINYRDAAKNFDDYFTMINKNMAATGLKGKKRVWIIAHEHLDITVGTYVDKPDWYYERGDGISRFKTFLSQHGRLLKGFHLKTNDELRDVNISLYDFSAEK